MFDSGSVMGPVYKVQGRISFGDLLLIIPPISAKEGRRRSNMNTRRKFLAAVAALAALSFVPQANADQNHASRLYIHGMVWNRDLPAPMNDWLLRLDAQVDVPIGNAPMPPNPGFATVGDDFHDGPGSHVAIRDATLKGDQLVINGVITESKSATLVGQAVRIEGKVVGSAVQGLTVTIGNAVFNGAGLLVVIAIIAILIAL